jgi:hypothetical protein
LNAPVAAFESPLHEALGMRDQELRSELVQRGLDPADESQALRSMISVRVERAISRSESERLIADLLLRF